MYIHIYIYFFGGGAQGGGEAQRPAVCGGVWGGEAPGQPWNLRREAGDGSAVWIGVTLEEWGGR